MTHQAGTPVTVSTHDPGGIRLVHYGLLALAVLISSLIGIASRPLDQLAMLWPTNAFLLGLFLRTPRLVSPAGWSAAATGYVLADVVTGSGWVLAIALNLVNLLSVCIALTLCMRMADAERDWIAPGFLPRLFLSVVTASLGAGLAGGLMLWHMLGLSPWPNGASWAVSELHSYIVLLPTVLTAPAMSAWRWRERRHSPPSGKRVPNVLPVLCLLAALLATVFIGGPGALAFPVIALLACALSYSLFTTSLLTLAFSLLAMLSATSGHMPVLPDVDDIKALLSMRLGVASIALAPIAVASVMAARENSLAALRYLAEHDALTGLLNRRTFHQRAKTRLTQLAEQQKPAAMLMIDIDHFKSINDTHGHAVGDEVLNIVASRLRQSLRSDDLCGRVGGEEFSVLIAECTQDRLEEITLRIHAIIENEIRLPEALLPQALKISVSIGATLRNPASENLEAMLLKADRALYMAKNSGRNQTRFL